MTVYLSSAGWVSRGGMGGGLSWPEIRAWREESGYAPTECEREMLYQLSGMYAAMFSAAQDPAEPQPSSEISVSAQTAQQMSAAMDMLTRKK